MKILFFDDDITRHERFADLCQQLGTVAISAYSPHDAICLIRTIKFDYVYLDHDMDLNVPGGGDGRTVARYIAYQLDRKHYPDGIIIHSWNVQAAKEMEKILEPTKIPVQLKPFRID